MIIHVTAKPKKKKEYVEQVDADHYIVAVKEPAIQGKANQAVINSLAGYFNVSKSQIRLTSGLTNQHKTLRVPDHLAGFVPVLKQITLF